MAFDPRVLLRKELPSSLTTPQGHTFSIDWFDDDGAYKPEDYPHGTFQFLQGPIPQPGRLGLPTLHPQTVEAEAHTFTSPNRSYRLDHPDILKVTKVSGTQNGNPKNFNFIAEARDGYWRPSHVTFPQDDLPDDGTQFHVDYEHALVQPNRIGEIELPINLAMRAAETRKDGYVYSANDLAQGLATNLFAVMSHRRGETLHGTHKTDQVVLGPPRLFMPNFSSIMGESVAAWTVQITLLLRLRTALTPGLIKTINKTVTSTEAEL